MTGAAHADWDGNDIYFERNRRRGYDVFDGSQYLGTLHRQRRHRYNWDPAPKTAKQLRWERYQKEQMDAWENRPMMDWDQMKQRRHW